MKNTYFLPFLIVALIFCVNKTNAQTLELWGVTQYGGDYNAGTIFKIDSAGNNHSVPHSLFKNEGYFPKYTQLCSASNGKLYGMTSDGGLNYLGVIFEYDPVTNIYTKKFDFDGAATGQYPEGSLMQATNGKLYGMTRTGGANNRGVLFEYDPITNVCTNKIDFDLVAKGAWPRGSLIQASNGKLYGMTSDGGTSYKGVIFEYDPVTNIFTKKFDFNGTVNGATPYGSLTIAPNGKLYGLTTQGGTNGKGVLFEYDLTTNTFIKKLNFGYSLGSSPYGSLMKASNGMLYGMANYGGANGKGTMFEYNTVTSTFTKKVDFDGAAKGQYPNGSLVESSNGKLYGMTSSGGTTGLGVLFEYTPTTNTFTKKVDFDGVSKGEAPSGALAQGSNGKLYGMTENGGLLSYGVLFEFDPTLSLYAKKLDFYGSFTGQSPYGSLMQASNGKLYGMTVNGGITDDGVLFEYIPSSNTYSKKLDFNAATTGKTPWGSLTEASNGKLYGMTNLGGLNNDGVLFEYDPNTNTYVKKFDFNETTNGNNPTGSLVEAANGKLYGMTGYGGANSMGMIFEYDPLTNIFTKKIDFDGSLKGNSPRGSLIKSSNDKLYGMTLNGGTHGVGVLFEYDPVTNTFTKKLDFNGTSNGKNPFGSLTEASNNKLYGMTSLGGSASKGVIFEYDVSTGAFSKKLDFYAGNDASRPYGSLTLGSNGNLYGMTMLGGVSQDGVLFEWNISTNSYSKKVDFNGLNGSSPGFGQLLEVNTCYPTMNSYSATECNPYTVPSGDETYTIAGTYTVIDTIPNNCGGDSILTISVTVLPALFETYTDTVCFGDSIVVNGITYNANHSSGTQVFSNIGPNNCDSTLAVNLTILPELIGTLNQTVCYGDSIIINGTTYDANNLNGTEVYTNIGDFNCDSTFVVTLTILPELTGNLNQTICYGDSIIVNGTTYNSNNLTGTEVFTNIGSFSCDSTVTVNLTILPEITGTYNQTVCYGDSIIVNGTTYDASNLTGSEIFSGIGAHNCDSTVAVTLTILPQLTGIHNDTICYGDSIVVNGTTYNANNLTGTEVFTNIGQYNCDSIVIVSLTVLPQLMGTHNETVCYGDSIIVNGITYNANNLTGTEVFTNIGAYNCDSIFTVTLTILPEATSTLNQTLCFGDSIIVNGTTYNANNLTGTEVFTGVGPHYCDSTVTVSITILPQLTSTHYDTVCYGGSIIVNGTTYDANNLTGTEVFSNIGQSNCDSTVTISLTVLPQLTGTHNETVCYGDNIVVNGTTYDANNLTGTEVFANIGQYNCDSTVTVSLTVLPQLTSVHNETVCYGDSIVVNGTTYDANNLTGTEVFSNIGQNNCDSIVTVSLTVLPQLIGTHNETVCFGDSIIVNGITYNANNPTGTELFTNIGAYNCDSLFVVSLTILPELTGTYTETVCYGESIIVNGTTYDSNNLTGTEVFTGIGPNNCDSTVAVTLTILPELTGTYTETVCYGESIIVNGTTYDSNNLTGSEIFTGIGPNNCDSTVAVTLTIIPAIDVTVTKTSPTITANQTGATYQWLDCNNNNSVIVGATSRTYSATANGDYAVEITMGNCTDTSTCTKITSIGILENIQFNQVSIYPNPSKGNVNIELGNLNDVTVKVYNASGQLIYKKEDINSPLFQFHLNQSAGLYFIEIAIDGNSHQYQFIIK
jgi:uncharacterized repeat protein (TIGR03803 family)